MLEYWNQIDKLFRDTRIQAPIIASHSVPTRPRFEIKKEDIASQLEEIDDTTHDALENVAGD
jgi:hypothetical protein